MKANHMWIFLQNPMSILWNLFVVYLVYALCRIVFVVENWSVLSGGVANLDAVNIVVGCWRFDTAAILYTNILYCVLALIPFSFVKEQWWQKMLKMLYVAVNSICTILNLADSVYFRYTGRRSTASVFLEFRNEDNIFDILGLEVLNHWYLFLIGIVLIISIHLLYFNPCRKCMIYKNQLKLKFIVCRMSVLIVWVYLSVCGMRGGFTTAVRPITINNANQYINKPIEAGALLNTPFTIIRSFNKNFYVDPQYYSAKQLDSIYSPVYYPQDSVAARKKNVVILIVESFGREYIGEYNKLLDRGEYKGYTPFVDSLLSKSLSFEYTFSNGRKSIDGMPAILSSIPRFCESYVLTPASLNDVSGIAEELNKFGYYTAFFHGAENGSMGFQAFAHSTGFLDYFGRTEYCQDKRFNGDDDYDGEWAIWDEEFLQYYALKMNEMKEPFFTAVFTASSHHPYHVPERYKYVFKDEDSNVMHKCIRYVDYSLRKFFDTIKKEKWYDNTVFVITSDHTNLTDHKEYETDLGVYGAPIFIFDPSGDIKPHRRHCIAQHIDIMPTLLNYLGYNNPYIAFGQDLFSVDDDETWAVNNNNGVYQFIKGDFLIQYTEDDKLKGVYNYKHDWMLKHNLIGTTGIIENDMVKELKAIIQSYMQRMVNDELTIQTSNYCL